MDKMMVHKTEAQLIIWGEEIKRRENRLHPPGREPKFAAVLHVDELRIMLVTAQISFEALQADSLGHQILLTVEFARAWEEIAAAIKQRMPQP